MIAIREGGGNRTRPFCVFFQSVPDERSFSVPSSDQASTDLPTTKAPMEKALPEGNSRARRVADPSGLQIQVLPLISMFSDLDEQHHLSCAPAELDTKPDDDTKLVIIPLPPTVNRSSNRPRQNPQPPSEQHVSVPIN